MNAMLELRQRFWLGPAALVVVLLGPTAAVGGPPESESYYLVLFAAEDKEGIPVTTHCFATFARIGPGWTVGGEREVELHHINWSVTG